MPGDVEEGINFGKGIVSRRESKLFIIPLSHRHAPFFDESQVRMMSIAVLCLCRGDV